MSYEADDGYIIVNIGDYTQASSETCKVRIFDSRGEWTPPKESG